MALPDGATHSTRVLHVCAELRRLQAELALARETRAAPSRDGVTKADLVHALESHRFKPLSDLAGRPFSGGKPAPGQDVGRPNTPTTAARAASATRAAASTHAAPPTSRPSVTDLDIEAIRNLPVQDHSYTPANSPEGTWADERKELHSAHSRRNLTWTRTPPPRTPRTHPCPRATPAPPRRPP